MNARVAAIGAVFALTAALTSNVVMASSHTADKHLRKQPVEIDMIVTGANRSLGAPKSSTGDRFNKECPLCFHRDLYKRDEKRQGDVQPFPGD